MIRRSLVPVVPVVAVFVWLALVAPSRATQTPIPQSPGVIIAGSLVDGDLNPVEGAVLSLEANSRVVARATSGPDGRYAFSAVPAGEYLVRAVARGTSVTRTVRVTASAHESRRRRGHWSLQRA